MRLNMGGRAMPATLPTLPRLDVVLTYPPLGLIHATAVNYDDKEMAINTGAVALTRNSEVEITFTSRTGRRMLAHRIIAHVLSADATSARLTIHQCSDETMATLRKLMLGDYTLGAVTI